MPRDEISFSIRFNFSVLSSLDNVSSTDDNTDSSTSSKFSASSLNISRNAFSITPSSTALLCEQFAIPLFVAVRHFHTGFLCFISWLWKCLVRLVQQKPHWHILLKAYFLANLILSASDTFSLVRYLLFKISWTLFHSSSEIMASWWFFAILYAPYPCRYKS